VSGVAPSDGNAPETRNRATVAGPGRPPTLVWIWRQIDDKAGVLTNGRGLALAVWVCGSSVSWCWSWCGRLLAEGVGGEVN
jgi:hypothetical protein